MPPGQPAQGPYRQPGAQYGPPVAQGKPRNVAPPGRRQVVRRLNLASVVKVSAVFYFCVMIVLLIAGALLWDLASAAGLIHSLDRLVRSLFALSSFQLHWLAALEWGAAIIGSFCLIGIFVNLLAAILYNLISDIVGGVRVTVVDEPNS